MWRQATDEEIKYWTQYNKVRLGDHVVFSGSPVVWKIIEMIVHNGDEKNIVIARLVRGSRSSIGLFAPVDLLRKPDHVGCECSPTAH